MLLERDSEDFVASHVHDVLSDVLFHVAATAVQIDPRVLEITLDGLEIVLGALGPLSLCPSLILKDRPAAFREANVQKVSSFPLLLQSLTPISSYTSALAHVHS